MFWHGQYFVAVNGLTLLMFWHSRCFGTFDIIEPLIFWCSRTNAGEWQSLRDLKYQPYLYTDCTKTLTAPKHWPHRNTDPKIPKKFNQRSKRVKKSDEKRLKMGKLKHVHWNIIFSNFLIYPKNNIEYMNLTTWMRYESRGIMAGPSVTLIKSV